MGKIKKLPQATTDEQAWHGLVEGLIQTGSEKVHENHIPDISQVDA